MSGTLPRIAVLDTGARESNTPINVLFELTHRCNLRCFHCYVIADKRPELDTHEVRGVLDQLAEAGTLFITFTGGEIMLRQDLFEVLEHARDRHFAIRLFTNGTLIDEEAADRIARIKPVDVGVSVYGPTAEIHEAVTKARGSFDKSVRALQLLHDRGIMTHLKCVLMEENVNVRGGVGDLADELGAYAQFDPQVTPRNDGDLSPTSHSIDDTELSNVVHASQLRGALDLDTALCAAGRDSASISPAGDVLPCVQWPMPIGNLRQQSFSEIWSSPEASAIRDLTMSKLDTCRDCPDLGFCSLCLGLNYVENGDATRPSSSVCRMARARKKGAEG